ncbi:interleukin-23 subunit alpha [Apteryx mantelli]|uniref:Interleukin-23 subunit alpha n=1 Tax=Apteryx mantelli TaxID=2696672 RepID=A0ABM4FYV2_9AVES|nr:interleukin-23 subunit alpha [Apteryx rowi]
MAPRLCLCLLALLLPAPVPAPRLPRTDWAACRSLSRELSRLLGDREAPHRVLEEMRLDEEAPEEDWPPRIRCSDACDPSTLDTNNTRCLRRILQGLQHYRDLLDSDIFNAHRLPLLETTLDKLLGLIQQEHGRPPRRPPTPSAVWAQPLLQHQALERLQSFTAVMSRVFTHSASTR